MLLEKETLTESELADLVAKPATAKAPAAASR
jgi:hypothetical protein